MSRTIKDLPYFLWQAELLRIPPPPHPVPPAPWRDPLERQAWRDAYRVHPAHGWRRDTMDASDRRTRHHRHRAYVRNMLSHGRYDDIEPARHLTGWYG